MGWRQHCGRTRMTATSELLHYLRVFGVDLYIARAINPAVCVGQVAEISCARAIEWWSLS